MDGSNETIEILFMTKTAWKQICVFPQAQKLAHGLTSVLLTPPPPQFSWVTWHFNHVEAEVMISSF